MNLKTIILRLSALFYVWAVVLFSAALIDKLFGTIFQPLLGGWLLIGFITMLQKKIMLPAWKSNRSPIRVAFELLWWALWWPKYIWSK